MRHLDFAFFSTFFKRMTLLSILFSVFDFAHGQAPVAANDTLYYSWGIGCNSIPVLSYVTGAVVTITSFDHISQKHGHISQNPDSTLCYTAPSLFSGTDIFEYTVCTSDSQFCTTGTVVVIVPVGSLYDTTREDSATTINITGADTSEYVSSICAQPSHGTVMIVNGSTVLYTPALGYPTYPAQDSAYLGRDSFCILVCLNGSSGFCSATEVYVSVQPGFFIPQGISPNGDGVNDYFVIANVAQYSNSQLLIYNRYGDEVWSSDGNGYANDFGGTWKKNGQPLPDGSYWYIFKFGDGITKDRIGYLIIQR